MGKINIAHNNFDIIFKNLTSVFKEGGLKALQIESEEIDTPIDTGQPIIDIYENQMDMVFRLKDSSFLHLEFQTTNKRTDLSRFLIYDARLYESVRNSVEDNVRIRTIVIYGPNTGNPKSSIDAGSFSYNVEHIYLSKMDGENIFHSLFGKIESGENLSETEKVSLILSPLMDIKEEREIRALQTVEIASEIKEDKGYIIGAIIGLTNTIVSKDIQQKMLEVFQVTDAFRELEEKIQEKAMKKMRRDDIYYLLDNEMDGNKFDKKQLKHLISQIDSLELLERLYKFANFERPNLDEFKKRLSDFLTLSK